MKNYVEYVSSKDRESHKHLELIKKIFEQANMKVVDKLDKRDDPYIFVANDGDLSFEGIRIYQIGEAIAFRVQKEPDTHPYGRAYPLNVEQMFEELMGDERSDEEIGKEIIQALVAEVKDFFEQSLQAERSGPQRYDPLSRILTRSSGTDYASQVFDVRRDGFV